MSVPAAPAPPRALDARLMTLLAITMFAAAGSIHFQTAMLGAIAQEFGADTRAVGWIPTMTFAGFVSGIVFIVPLGDRADKRRIATKRARRVSRSSRPTQAMPAP